MELHGSPWSSMEVLDLHAAPRNSIEFIEFHVHEWCYMEDCNFTQKIKKEQEQQVISTAQQSCEPAIPRSVTMC